MKNMKKPLIILTGPTAVGKTALSILIAQEIGAEIISADSIQVYKYMNIGSAKVTQEEMNGVPHFLVNELEPDAEFNVYRFQKMAKTYINEIYSRGHIPMLVGGTGFYIQSVLYDIAFSDSADTDDYRQQLETLAKEKGNLFLHEMLRQTDPVSAAAIHPNNRKRVIRALEYYRQNGTPISAHNAQERQKTSPYQFHYFVLTDDRQALYDRINRRVDLMMEAGLLDEVKQLRSMGYGRNLVSMQGIGYKELFAHLDGEMTLQEAVALIKQETRHFAKRQLTWFRREKAVDWVDISKFSYDKEQILHYMLERLQQEKTKGDRQ